MITEKKNHLRFKTNYIQVGTGTTCVCDKVALRSYNIELKCGTAWDSSCRYTAVSTNLSKCHLLHNLHSLQKVIHRRNRETTWRPITRTPS